MVGQWLGRRSLVELLDDDFETLDLNRFDREAERLLAHRATLEAFRYQQECDLFGLSEALTLDDLTNAFFEGTAKGNAKAQRGHSKEQRSDCPLATLVLDASGFPKRSEVFAGNVSEPQTLEQMLQHLRLAPGTMAPTVVMDAGLATEENLAWLQAQGYRYLVVSRQRHKQFDPEQATLVRAEGATRIGVQRVVEETTGEVCLYCHRFSARLETELQYLAEGLYLPRRVKHYAKVLTRIGRLRQRSLR